MMAQQGDLDAYQELVRRHQQLAQRVAWLVVGSSEEARDAAQEGFVRAFGALHRFRSGARFRSWLLAIVANEARNRRRSAGRRTRRELQVAMDPASEDAAPSPEAEVLAGERRQLLLSAVEQLPTHERQVVGCRYFLELSEEETSRALGVALGTVKSRHARALARLRRTLPGEASEVEGSRRG